MPRAKAPAAATAAASPPDKETAVVSASSAPAALPAPASKLDRLVALLSRPEGATLAQMTETTGWQAHSVRGALAGSLRKIASLVRSI